MLWNEQNYEIIENVKEGFDKEAFLEKATEYFVPFDYILGDWSYGKLRLKGFYEKNHPEVKKYNEVTYYKNYIKESCAYGCKYFLLKKRSS